MYLITSLYLALCPLKNCKNTYKNTYRRFFHESRKDKYLKHLKENLQNYDLNSLDPNSLMDIILLCIKVGKKMWKVIREATNTKPKPEITPDFVRVRTADGNYK